MAEDEDQGSKNEAPSEQKLRKAREKGDVPLTREPGHLLSYTAVMVLAGFFAPSEVPKLISSLEQLLTIAPQLSISTGDEGIADLRDHLYSPMIGIGIFMAKVMGIFMAAGIIGAIAQGPFVFAGERITPKFSKISPMKGLKKMFGVQNLVEFGKNLTKLILLIAITLWLTEHALLELLPGTLVFPEAVSVLLSDHTRQMLLWIIALMIPIAIGDLVWKRISYTKKQRMSHKEVRDEHKNSEGDPHIKARRDQIRRARARSRLATAVPTATLVVVNPTHYAVALRYEKGIDAAPVCVAKGTDLVAKRIRKIAHENEIAVLENVPLARALHASVEVDDMIPEDYWPAVAELVGYIYDLRKRIHRKPPEGAVLVDD